MPKATAKITGKTRTHKMDLNLEIETKIQVPATGFTFQGRNITVETANIEYTHGELHLIRLIGSVVKKDGSRMPNRASAAYVNEGHPIPQHGPRRTGLTEMPRDLLVAILDQIETDPGVIKYQADYRANAQ